MKSFKRVIIVVCCLLFISFLLTSYALYYKKRLILNISSINITKISTDKKSFEISITSDTNNEFKCVAFNDLYMFEFYRIGQDNSNKLMVVTNKGTNEIISMYPTQSNIKCQINDNLYRQVLEEESSKVKKISQIDKFNKRYGLK